MKLLELELEAEPNDPSPEPDDEGITVLLAISTRHYSRSKTKKISKTRFKGNVGKLLMAWGFKEGDEILDICKFLEDKRQRGEELK